MNTSLMKFHIPEALHAADPPEKRLSARDQVKLLVLDRQTGKFKHDQFVHIRSYLEKGDLLIFNNSRTIPAVLRANHNGKSVEVRLSRRLSDSEWDVLLPESRLNIGENLKFSNGVSAIITGYGSEPPLVKIDFSARGTDLLHLFYETGDPIRYEYIHHPWPLEAYQTVFATAPGSVEMPSAGRAFSWKLIKDLKKEGIGIAFLSLHAGLSYYGNDKWPSPKKHPETYSVPKSTAEKINEAKRNGKRVIAVGTTVVRALETAAGANGLVEAEEGTTSLYVTKNYPLRAADGLITGFHEPEASHLDMLTSFVQEEFLLSAYQNAISKNYLWHEFGDMNIILPLKGK
ncbi:S-adenosylmethionine:tRNA ribosyltransferase-isomerase [Bacillus capparidis]|uniref:S-adenosylmethionine:tRNA ribosyltransferase-isomerase n=1 Tax=Bacillus capparidis TaxID=1840411 RepID=A0ABS4CY77_9BACI|nr:S-adenosylmethionine:tRNA ribosyltransferase-isomerase [Bacillus capparidis]MBP1082318.1 S-adenosylmethionine:tRNA ribosyltransferase-isomerase [Bacillus capparidis]MED1097422.1 S-adenosylmethionine:tRNA ribosyltransferase-isomerase [Bacillus capparidis]